MAEKVSSRAEARQHLAAAERWEREAHKAGQSARDRPMARQVRDDSWENQPHASDS